MKIKLLTLFACLCFELQGLTASQYYLGVTYDGITYLVDEAKKTAMVGHTDCKGDIVIKRTRAYNIFRRKTVGSMTVSPAERKSAEPGESTAET